MCPAVSFSDIHQERSPLQAVRGLVEAKVQMALLSRSLNKWKLATPCTATKPNWTLVPRRCCQFAPKQKRQRVPRGEVQLQILQRLAERLKKNALLRRVLHNWYGTVESRNFELAARQCLAEKIWANPLLCRLLLGWHEVAKTQREEIMRPALPLKEIVALKKQLAETHRNATVLHRAVAAWSAASLASPPAPSQLASGAKKLRLSEGEAALLVSAARRSRSRHAAIAVLAAWEEVKDSVAATRSFLDNVGTCRQFLHSGDVFRAWAKQAAQEKLSRTTAAKEKEARAAALSAMGARSKGWRRPSGSGCAPLVDLQKDRPQGSWTSSFTSQKTSSWSSQKDLNVADNLIGCGTSDSDSYFPEENEIEPSAQKPWKKLGSRLTRRTSPAKAAPKSHKFWRGFRCFSGASHASPAMAVVF